MPLDRQAILRRDFPIARRGYDIEAVDAHLELVAGELEALQQGAGRARASLASAASDQVRAIVEAAEQTAADLQREADLESRQVRQDAREEAERTRADAGRRAREHVQQVAEAARTMLERLEAMERDLGELLTALRGGGHKLSAELSLLQAAVAEVRGVASGLPPGEPPAPVGPSADGAAPPTPAASPPAAGPPEGGAPVPAAGPPEGGAPVPAAGPPEGVAAPLAAPPGGTTPPSPAEEGARLVALNMALQGADRAEAARYLAEAFDLTDVDALLDDVYARAGR